MVSLSGDTLFLLLLIAFDQTPAPQCFIDQCDESSCIIETPEGYVSVPKKHDYKEGLAVECPIWLIDPT